MTRALIGLVLTLLATGCAFAQPPESRGTGEALALVSQPALDPDERADLAQWFASEENPETVVALLAALARHGMMDSAAQERAAALALDSSLDPALRRQALSTLGIALGELPSETFQAILTDSEVGSLAEAMLEGSKSLPRPTPLNERPLREGCTLILHGSFAVGTANSWWQRGDGFCEHLDDEVGNVWRIVDEEGDRVISLYPMSWPASSPSDSALVAGGELIARHLLDLALNDPPPLDIVAHSNGGNVIVRALAQAMEQDPNLRVRTLVLIGVPHVVVDGQLHHWPSDPNHPLYSNCESIVNIFAPEDTYGTSVAAAVAPGPVVQALEPLGLPNVIDLPVETRVGCFNAHIVLHSNAMARQLGQALRGEVAWVPASFQPIDDPSDHGITP